MAAGIAVLAVSMFFWLTLTLMAGTFFESVVGVIAVPLVAYFALWFLPGVITPLFYVSPVVLSIGDLHPGLAVALMNGEAPFSWVPLIRTILFSGLFIAVAIWRFNRQEL